MEQVPKGRDAVDAYLKPLAAEVRARCESLRQLIRSAVPEAEETISWGMPTFKLEGNLVHFAVHNHHIGFYPGADGVEAFLPELAAYAHSKGAIQFPFDKPLPLDLIERITRFRAAANLRYAAEKRAEKAAKRSKAKKADPSGSADEA